MKRFSFIAAVLLCFVTVASAAIRPAQPGIGGGSGGTVVGTNEFVSMHLWHKTNALVTSTTSGNIVSNYNLVSTSGTMAYGTNSGRITNLNAGYYKLQAGYTIAGVASRVYEISIRTNGTICGLESITDPSGVEAEAVFASGIVYLPANTEIAVYHQADSATTISFFAGSFTVSAVNNYSNLDPTNAVLANIIGTGAFTNANMVFSNTIVVNAGPDQAANGLRLTNAMATLPQYTRLIVGPGDYFVGEVAIPSPAFATDNRVLDFQPGANVRVGSPTSAGFAIFGDAGGKVTNVWVMGRGNFYQTNAPASSGILLYLENGSTVHFEHQNYYNTNGDSCFNLAGVGNNTLTWVTHGRASTWSYDNAYFTMDSTNRVLAHWNEIETVGDIIELGGNAANWGDVIVSYNHAWARDATAGQASIMQVGGRAIVKNGVLNVERTNAAIYSTSATTNGLIEGGLILMPPNGRRSVLEDNSQGTGVPLNGMTALWLKNIYVRGATNVDAFSLTNGTVNETILENVRVDTGWASTNVIRATTPSKVRIIGNLEVHPYRPFGTGITIVGTNATSAIRNVGTLVNHGAIYGSNIIWSLLGISTAGNVSGADLVASGDVSGATITASTGIGTAAINIGNPTPSSIAMINGNGDLTNATLGAGLSLTGTTLSSTGGGSTQMVAAAIGTLTVTNNIEQLGDGATPGSHILYGTNAIGVTFKAANSNSVAITHIVGLLHKASASVIVLDCNHGNRFQVTNRLGQGTTFVVTNLAQGQEITIKGSASGGNYSVTVVPQLGYLVRDFDAFGVAAALNKAITATNGNTFEINIAAAWEHGTNWADVVTRQATY